jgi:dTDP-4-dehydrorhamnose reductase
MKIFVLGSTGMLGRYVSSYLGKKYKVINLSRQDVDVADVTEYDLKLAFRLHDFNDGDVVINCIGAIKPTVDLLGDLNALKINSIFPRVLANVVNSLNGKLIHPTTDCVYTGQKGNYTEQDKHDITDVYGRTKSLGEPNNCTVIRTSIIGEEVNQGRSLVEWIKSQNDKTVFGFTNHIWNGVTCLQFAKICDNIIINNSFWIGVKHVFSNHVTKYELLQLVIKHYNLNIEVTAKEAGEKCDRTLSSIDDYCSTLNIPPLDDQIKDMKEFNKLLYNND